MQPATEREIYPCLWLNDTAAEVAEFYCKVFPGSSIVSANPMVVIYRLRGRKIMFLNGGPHFTLSEAFSMVVECDTQEEIDRYWELLSEGGEEQMCGWVKDKFGISWQIIPSVLGSLMNTPGKAERVVQAFLKMKKFDIQTILDA